MGWLLKGAVGIASALGAKTLIAGVVTLAAVASLGLISCMSDTGSDSAPVAMNCDADPASNPTGDCDDDDEPNDTDNCRLVANSDQADADGDGEGDLCDDDRDGDGIVNGDDLCPDTNNANNNDTDGDGVGDICDDDSDGDGVSDEPDNCPLVANPLQLDFNDDGVGDACDDDDDGDGISNDADNCPLIANPANADGEQPDNDGDGEGDVCDDDDDNDGRPDGGAEPDNCPFIANPLQLDFNDDGEGDACDDSDGDTKVDKEDNCPEVANLNQSDTDGDGVGDACDERDDGDSDDDGTLNYADIDDDNDGLIEINTLEELDFLRYNLAGTSRKTSASDSGISIHMGAPTSSTSNCSQATPEGAYLCGYELSRNLDFDEADSYAAGVVNRDWRPIGDPLTATGTGFEAIGDPSAPFNAIFDGGGFTISHLFVNKNGKYAGLFGATSDSALIRNLGLLNASVDSSMATGGLVIELYVGGLVGSNRGRIEFCYSTGHVVSLGATIGGLVGENRGNSAAIIASYSSSTVGGSARIGGLVGHNTDGALITASYASGSVTGIHENGASSGGLVGATSRATINSSYATGQVLGQSVNVGGFAGYAGTNDVIRGSWSSGRVEVNTPGSSSEGGFIGGGVTGVRDNPPINSYWDGQSSGQAMAQGTATTDQGGIMGRTTAQMQAVGGSSLYFACGNPFSFRRAGETPRYPKLKRLVAGKDTADCEDDRYHSTELLGGQ